VLRHWSSYCCNTRRAHWRRKARLAAVETAARRRRSRQRRTGVSDGTKLAYSLTLAWRTTCWTRQWSANGRTGAAGWLGQMQSADQCG